MPSMGVCLLLDAQRAVGVHTDPLKIHESADALREVLLFLLKEVHWEHGMQVNRNWLYVLSAQTCHPLIRMTVEKQGFRLHERVDFANGGGLASVYRQNVPAPQLLVMAYPTQPFLKEMILHQPCQQRVWLADSKPYRWKLSRRHITLSRLPTYCKPKTVQTSEAIVLLDIENIVEARDTLGDHCLRDLFLVLQGTVEWLEKRHLTIDRQHSLACLRYGHPERERIRKAVEFFGLRLGFPDRGRPAEVKLDRHAASLLRLRKGPSTVLVMSGDGDLLDAVVRLQKHGRYVVSASWLAQASRSMRRQVDEFVPIEEIFSETGHHCVSPHVRLKRLVC